MRKRIWSVLLCLCLLLGLMAGVTLGAEDPETSPDDPPVSCREGCSLEPGHEGDCVLHEARYRASEEGEWLYGTLADACAGVYEGGSVELLRDVDQPAPVTVTKPLLLTSALPEGQFQITYNNTDHHDPYLLTVKSDVMLQNIILDGGAEEGRVSHTELVGVQGGYLTMGDGAVIQNNDNVGAGEGAGGLRVISGVTVLAQGSVIRNCRGRAGGGVATASNSAGLLLQGGTIEGCRAYRGGGVFMGGGQCIMRYGSSIRENTATATEDGTQGYGGGVFVDGGMLQLPGGEIRGNCAQYGGGLCLFSGQTQLGNVIVTENTAQVYGGGILSAPNAALGIGSPGTLCEPKVTGNKSGVGYFDNIYLDGSSGDPPVSGSVRPTQPMALIYDLGPGAALGISRWVRPDPENRFRTVVVPANGHVIDGEDLAKFHSDDPACVTLLHPSEGRVTIALTAADVVFDTRGHGETPPGQQVTDDNDRKVAPPADPVAAGYTFLGWTTDEAGEAPWNFDEPVEAFGDGDLRPIMTLYAQWDLNHYRITYDLAGGSVEENPEEYTVESGAITLNQPTRRGYAFRGWTGDDVAEPQPEVTIPEHSVGDRAFTAQWEAICYHIGYELDGGSAEGNPEEYTIESDAITLNQPTREGYTFQGWTWDDVTEPQREVTIPAESIGDRTFTAHWAEVPPPPPPHSSDPDPKPEPEPGPDQDLSYVGCPRDETCPIWPYTDASTTAWYHDGVHYCIENGLMEGYGDDVFAPDDPMSRGMLAMSLYNREGRPAVSGPGPFSDVDPGLWYADAITWAAEHGVVEGYGDGTFGPQDPITREQLATMFYRYEKEYRGGGFPEVWEFLLSSTDADRVSDWAYEAICWMVKHHIVEGKPDELLDPAGLSTRAEAAALLQRFFTTDVSE